MLSKSDLSQRHKADETKQSVTDNIAYLIENALRHTLYTVNLSSNLTPISALEMAHDWTDGSILRPLNDELSRQWPLFSLNRTISHTPFNNGKHLVTTYDRLPWNSHWQQVFKIVDKHRWVYFEDSKMDHLFSNLGLSHYNFVSHNIQARNERSGNCFILSQALCYFLWQQAIKLHDNRINRIEIIRFQSLDHCFVLINRDLNSLLTDYTTWNGWIIDSWRGVKGKASVLHSDDFFSYTANLRNYRPDIIIPDMPPTLDVEAVLSITDINHPENISLFKKLEELIHHGKMGLIAEKKPCSQQDIDTHKSRFFAVAKEIESRPQKDTGTSLGTLCAFP